MSNTSLPLISIVIPAYKAEKFINETLDSVVNQTYRNIEAFVIDDGSPDNTLEMARKFESEKLKVLTQKNQGACVARNKGLSMSTGKYIQFLDADDVLSYDKIAEQVKILENNPGCLGVSPSVHFMDGDDYKNMQPREEKFWIHDTDNPVDFLIRLYGGDGERWMVQTSAWLTPKSICDKIGPWDEALLLDQDGEYFARAVLASKGIRTTGGTNYYRRFFYGGNISAKAYKKENLQSALHALNCKSKYLAAYDQSDRLKQALATLYLEIAINAYPVHKDLTALCEEKIRETGKKGTIPILGGLAIETIKKVFGWKAAKMFSYLVHKKRK
jgi:glycosyltransferase involved in cell wall biosynthesis